MGSWASCHKALVLSLLPAKREKNAKFGWQVVAHIDVKHPQSLPRDGTTPGVTIPCGS